MGKTIDELKNELWAAIRKAQIDGYPVNSDTGGYYVADTSEALCLVGAVLHAHGYTRENVEIGESIDKAAEALGISEGDVVGLEDGFEDWDDDLTDKFVALGREIREALAQESPE